MPITSNPRALDTDVIIDGARAALLAAGAVTAITTTVVPEAAPEGTVAPYVVLALASTVYASTYNSPTLNTLLDVSCYTAEWSTTVVRALMAACLTALIDTPWAIAGMTTISVNMEESGTGFRNISVVTNGTMVRGRQATLRVRASKP